MSMHIVDDEQRRDRPQSPCAQRVSSGAGHLRRSKRGPYYYSDRLLGAGKGSNHENHHCRLREDWFEAGT